MTLRLLEPGLYTLLVDQGRPRHRSLGIPVGGAADRFSLTIGNALVGNRPEAAALEICLRGPTVQAAADLTCVLFGSPFEIICGRKTLPPGMPFLLKKRQTLRIGGTPSGMRAYLCVAGGFQAQEVLGSVSSLEPLQAPMDLMCTSGQFPLRSIHGPFLWNQAERTLHVVQGAQADWFPEGCLMGQEFAVTPAGNRMGLRLQGAPLPVPNRELVSEPVSPGAVQVTREGQCIVLGVDGQTIGGYPKIAHVISADLDKLGQLRPGEIIRFQHVSLPEAEALFKRKQAELREWLMRLQIAEGIRGNSSEALKGRDIEAQGKR